MLIFLSNILNMYYIFKCKNNCHGLKLLLSLHVTLKQVKTFDVVKSVFPSNFPEFS